MIKKILGCILAALVLFCGIVTTVNITSDESKSDLSAIVQNMPSDTNLLPKNIYSLQVAKAEFPCWWQLASKCIDGEIAFQSFIVEYNDGFVVIDPVHNKTWHDKFLFKTDYDQAAYDAQAKILQQSRGILITHEHWDHTGIVLDDELFEKTKAKFWITEPQLQGIVSHGYRDLVKKDIQLLNQAKSPFAGISYLSTPGHSQGHQMISIQLQSGEQYILTGDIAYNYQSFEENRTRPLIASLLGGEQPFEVADQVTALSKLVEKNSGKGSKLRLIPAHDQERTKKLIQHLPKTFL